MSESDEKKLNNENAKAPMEVDDNAYILSLLQMALAVRNGEATWKSVQEYANAHGEAIAQDTIRKGFKYAFSLFDAGLINTSGNVEGAMTDDNSSTISVSKSMMDRVSDIPANKTINADGSRSYDRLVVLMEGQEDLSEAEMMKFFNLSPDDWVMTSCKLQSWHGQVKDGGKQLLYNLRINVRPKFAKDFGLSDIEAFFDRNQKGIASLPMPKFKEIDGPEEDRKIIKQIDLADTHFGLLAWKPETGEHYDLDIASQYTLDCFKQFIERNRNQKIDEIVLVTMGDIIHVDNGNFETAHGTRQDTEGRVPKMIDKAVATLVTCVRMLEKLNIPIKYVYVPGNHDQNLGYAAARMVQMAFINDPNVTFDVRPTYYKCLEYGRTSVVVTHGEAPNKRLPNELLTKHRDAYGRTGASEVHAGHLHSQAVEYIGPVLVRRVPAICASSYWENSKGFPSIGRGMQVFTYDTSIAGCSGIESYYTGSVEE